MSKTHWRKIAGKEFLVGEMLDGKDIKLTIKEVRQEEIQNIKGKETKPVCYFHKTDQKLVLNVTNMKAISQVLGSPFIEEWAGKEITLTTIRGRFFGEDQEVIRIKKDIQKLNV